MSVRGQNGYFAEPGLNPYTAISIVRPADLDARRVSIIGNDLAARESHKVANESVSAVDRHVNPVFGNGLKLRVIGRSRVPIELHMDAARPGDDDVLADGIGKRRHDDIRVV